MKIKGKYSLITILFLVMIIDVTSVSSQTQRRFFVKKDKRYHFSLFIGSARGMGGVARLRIVKRINAEIIIGVASFVNSRYFTPYPGNTFSLSLRLRTNLYKNFYFSGGWYNGVFNITDNIQSDLPQMIKFVDGYSFSIGFRKFFLKRVGFESGVLFGLPDKIVEISKGNILVTSKREPRELSFVPLVTVLIDL